MFARILWMPALGAGCVAMSFALSFVGGRLQNASDGTAYAGEPGVPAAGADDDAARAAALKPAARAVTPLHAPKRKPRPGDWLSSHEEAGQTFDEYVRCDPNRPGAKRTTLYILPLGDFNEHSKKLVADTAEMMGVFFGVPVKTLEPMGLKAAPASARRPSRGPVMTHDGMPADYGEQLSTGWVMDVLKGKRAEDAVGVIALAGADLWPGEANWNYVFGQASLSQRVGVWSFARFGDPARNYALALRRTLKTAIHETGHMLGIQHCIAWECGMNGSNNMDEADATPIAFCPECDRKIWWACRTDPAKRYKALAEFCESRKLEPEAQFWRRSAEVLKPGK